MCGKRESEKYSIVDARMRSILIHTPYQKALLSSHFAGTKRTFFARVEKMFEFHDQVFITFLYYFTFSKSTDN